MKYLLSFALIFMTQSSFAVGPDGRPSAAATTNSVDSERYVVDTAKSTAKWEGKKLTGGHDGKIKISSGSLLFKGPSFVGGEFVIDMTKISVDDIKDKEKAAKLKGHLESDDFFSVDKYKTAKLVIKDVQFGKGGMYDVAGDLTIKGKTHPVSFMADVSEKGDMLTASADIVFNRAKYDVRYGSGSFFDDLGDKMIYDDISVKVELTAKK